MLKNFEKLLAENNNFEKAENNNFEKLLAEKKNQNLEAVSKTHAQ